MNPSIRARMLASGMLALLLGLGAWLAPAAQASQRPTAPSAATYPYKFSRIAWTGSDELIAATDSHGDLYYFWQASGTTTWHKQLVAKGGSGLAYKKPSIAWTGHAVAIAAVDASGDLVYFAKTTGATKWRFTLLATSSSGTFQAPAVTAAADGSVLVSAGNTAGELESFTLAPGATSWAEQTVASGLFGPSSITTVPANVATPALGLVTASSGGTLYFWWEFLSAPGWNQETLASPGTGSSYTGGSVAVSAGYVLVTAATTTGTVDFFTQPIGGSGWTQQTVAATGGPYTSPQITWTRVHNQISADVITAATKAGALEYWYAPDGGAGFWTHETVAANGSRAVFASPGISATSSSVVITAINTKPGNVMYWYQPFATNPWNRELVATG
jgi:hypothetical protein